MQAINKAKNAILKSKTIVIASHIHPDGDSIGSVLALGLGLKKLGKRVYMVSKDGVPERYKLLPGAKDIKRTVKISPDLAIAADCSGRDILGTTYNIFKKAKHILEIDHHEFRKPFGDIGLIDTEATSTGELIYLLLKKLRVKINKKIAQNILTSIIVETGSFRLPDVKPYAFELCGKLIKMGIDFYKLVEMVYWTRRKESLILSGVCFKRCKFLKNGRVAWTFIKRKDFENIGGKDEDIDAVADELRTIKKVDIVVLFREQDSKRIRVSLRSKGKYNVARIAEKCDGGGHFDVAGCFIKNNQKAVKKVLRDAVKSLN